MTILKKTTRRFGVFPSLFFLLALCFLCPLDTVVAGSTARPLSDATETTHKKRSVAEQILWQVDRNLRPESSEVFFKITNQSPNGRKSELSLFAVKGRGKKAAALIITPDAMKGRSALRLDDKVWVHIPGELELRQSSLSQSLTGGVFNNADILLADFSTDFKPTIVERKPKSYLLELIPRSKGLPYGKVLMRVDRQLLLPQTLAQYSTGGRLIKKVSFENITAVSGTPRPETVVATSALNPLYTATWQLGLVRARTFTKDTFTKKLLPRIGTLTK